MHGRPNGSIDYERVLRCPVRFDAAWDGVVYAEETLRLPVVGADNKLLRVLEVACRKIIGRARAGTISSIRCANMSCSGWPRARYRSTTWPAISA